MLNGPDCAFGGRLMQIDIKPFSEEETRSYLEEKAHDLTFTEEGFKRFYACTRGIPLNVNAFSSILPRYLECDEEIIKEGLYLNVDQVAIVWVYVWGRLNRGEKDFIIYILEHSDVFRKDLEADFPYSRSSIIRFIDSLSNKGILGYNLDRGYYILDPLLVTWLKIKFQTNGIYPE